MGRIEGHPILEFKKGPEVRFTFNGKEVRGYAGEPVASALYANGEKIFSRSLKYHRSRGMFCAIGKCSNCLMEVNGAPNVRTCTTPLKGGMEVKTQHTWPSAAYAVYSILDKLL